MALKNYIETRRTSDFETVSSGVEHLGTIATRNIISIGEGLEERIESKGFTDINYERIGAVDPKTWSATERFSFTAEARQMYLTIGASAPMEDSAFDLGVIAKTLSSISRFESGIANGKGAEKDRRRLAVQNIFNANALHADLTEEMSVVATNEAMGLVIAGEVDKKQLREKLELSQAGAEEAAEALRKAGEAGLAVDRQAFSQNGYPIVLQASIDMIVRSYDMKFDSLMLGNQLEKNSSYLDDYKGLLREQIAEVLDLANHPAMSAGRLFEYFAVCAERLQILKDRLSTDTSTRLTTPREDEPHDQHAFSGELRHAHDLVTTIRQKNGSFANRYQLKAMTKEQWLQREAEKGHVNPGYHDKIHPIYVSGEVEPSVQNIMTSIRELGAQIHGSTPTSRPFYRGAPKLPLVTRPKR